MTNRRSTIGGAVTAMGIILMGANVLTAKDSTNITILWWTGFIGFIMTAVGGFLTAFFAADAHSVRELSGQVNRNSAAIQETAQSVQSGDTQHLAKRIEETQTAETQPPKKQD